MNKLKAIIIVIALLIVSYLFLLVAIPILTDAVSTANTTMAASSNMSNYPGTQEAVLATPWIMFFLPAVIGIGAIIIILRQA